MIPEPITADELEDNVRQEVGADLNEEDLNLDSPYSISLPLSDWKSIIERLKIYEEFAQALMEFKNTGDKNVS